MLSQRDESLHVSSDEEGGMNNDLQSQYKIKQSSSHKGPYHFNKLKLVQDIAVHVVSNHRFIASYLFCSCKFSKFFVMLPEEGDMLSLKTLAFVMLFLLNILSLIKNESCVPSFVVIL